MSDSNKGLEQRYNITKIDGKDVHPDARYFVLRFDGFGDYCHVKASRRALATYAQEIKPHLPELAEDIMTMLDEMDRRENPLRMGHYDRAESLESIFNPLINPDDG